MEKFEKIIMQNVENCCRFVDFFEFVDVDFQLNVDFWRYQLKICRNVTYSVVDLIFLNIFIDEENW